MCRYVLLCPSQRGTHTGLWVTVMSEANDVRTALLNYLLMVKEFYIKLYTGPIVTKLNALFPKEQMSPTDEPLIVQIARAEKGWLNSLFKCLTTINQTMVNIEQWREWFFSIVENLNFSNENLQKLTKGPDIVFEELQSLNLDEGYVRLVVNNATSDFMDLVGETRRLLSQMLELDSCIKGLESPVLKLVEERLSKLKEVNYLDLLSQMQQLLAATYNAPTKNDFLRNLAALLHIFAGWRQMLQLDDPKLDDPKAMREFMKHTQNTLDMLNELTRAFQGFVEARNLADYYVRQAELSTIRMMLSYEGSAEQWWMGFIEGEPEQIKGFIPEKMDPHQLLIGVTHSLALMEDLDQRLLPQMPGVKTTVGKLGDFLQSPALHLFEEVTQNRLALWIEYEPKWVSLLVKLRTALHEHIKKAAL